METFEELVDEIYNKVSHLEPFVPGTANEPSTAACILFRVSPLGCQQGCTSLLNGLWCVCVCRGGWVWWVGALRLAWRARTRGVGNAADRRVVCCVPHRSCFACASQEPR